jgi:formylglycine-generating enzyme required for sulfatase activity
MTQIKANCFTMGGEEFVVEEPEHKVFLNSYYLGIYEIAQQKFENAMGYNPSRLKLQNLSAENVLWPEADAYFRALAGRLS